jgi:RNA polymerase sigma factor (sigma-70 family)
MPRTWCRRRISGPTNTSPASTARTTAPGCSRSCATRATRGSTANRAETPPQAAEALRGDDGTARDPEAAIAAESESALALRLVEELPAEFREVIVLRELEDLSYREIAAITGVPEGTVMSRLARARARLRELWEERSR